MKKYNFLRLLDIDEFDAQKQSVEQGCREAFYANLSTFLDMSEIIIKKCDLAELSKGGFNKKQHTKDISKLRNLLNSIGATALEKEIRATEKYGEDYTEYGIKLCTVFSAIEMLRKKIMNAEEPSAIISGGNAAQNHGNKNSMNTKEKAEIQRDKFERLFMLIDGFEYENAILLLQSIMKFGYTHEIDVLLESIFDAIHEFNYDLALRNASRLMKVVLTVEKARKRVLFIDDSPEIIRIVKSMLKDNYTVYGITNYNSVVRFLAGNNVDLVLLDIDMPEIDGFAMLQLIRKFPNYKKTPAIFLTGNATTENVRTALSLGAHDFITKPVNEQALIEKLEKALETVDNN